MHLREYLIVNGIQVKDFAEQIDYSPNHISQVCRNGHKASKKLGRIVERATGGLVTVDEIVNPKSITIVTTYEAKKTREARKITTEIALT